MTNIILTGAKTFGSTLLKTAGNIAVNYAGQTINNAFFGRPIHEGPRLQTLHIQSSQDGAPMARVYGKVRLAGQIVWAARVKEHVRDSTQAGKGGGVVSRDYSYTVSFAVGLCEGEILSVDRIWANGQPLKTTNVNMRVHKGGEDQPPDPLLSEIEGGAVPAFKGTAYVVFEDFVLDDYATRLPQFNFEVTCVPKATSGEPKLEDLIQGVNLIPGSGEFAYSTSLIERRIGRGATQAENMNNLSGQSDLDASLDQLQAQLPNCKSVNLIVSWFGDDLRAGHCKLRPGVESDGKLTLPLDWSVGGQTRENAYLVTQVDGRPAYGGTPSDSSVIEAIHALKSRGFNVCLHPFILMDIAADNSLSDPYGGAQQAAYVWRGRITPSPAIGQSGSVDKTSAADTQIAAFFGSCQTSDFSSTGTQIHYHGPLEDSYRRMVLHMAYLAKAAGGVDRFLIGSELRGLTTARGAGKAAQNRFPAVAALKTLAADVKSILGANTKLTYAADWSEYFGYHPADGSGDVYFHLDPLWSDSHIDAVGIDAYFPLSDWRDGSDHIDSQNFTSPYHIKTLQAAIEGEEGYDWYYANRLDRDAQIRSPIRDDLAHKPWVFRYKDIKNWWSNLHYDRIGGIEQSTPSDWTAQSKPIWFCELGCPAIDKGANQPNVFYDPKSSESFFPYYSNGSRNDLIQRRFLEAVNLYWNDPQNNPVSNQYHAPMLDVKNTHIWCWDGRPFPDFPARADVWSDGGNWNTGHWLNGRMGLVALADIIAALARRSGLSDIDVSGVNGVVSGAIIERPMSARAALASITNVYGVDMVETPLGVRFISSGGEANFALDPAHLIAQKQDANLKYTRRDVADRPLDVRISFIDGEHDYQSGSVYARDKHAQATHVEDFSAPVVLDHAIAKVLASARLQNSFASLQGLKFSLGPAHGLIECGDIIRFGDDETRWQVTGLDGQNSKAVAAKRLSAYASVFGGNAPPISRPAVWRSQPDLIILDCPQIGIKRDGVLVGALMQPFSPCSVMTKAGDKAVLTRAAKVGTLTSALSRGIVGLFDHQSFDIKLPNAELASLDTFDFLKGGNRIAVRTSKGVEILQARDIEFLGQDQYRLNTLLRGEFGTEDMMDAVIAPGAEIIVLDEAMVPLRINPELRGDIIALSVSTRGREAVQSYEFSYQALDQRPLSPVHVDATRKGGSIEITWIRRTRIGGDQWAALDVPLGEAIERYRVEILRGDAVLWALDSETPFISVPLSTLEAELGTGFTQITARVSQYSQDYGPGAAQTTVLPV